MKTKEELYKVILSKIEEMEQYKNNGSVVDYDVSSISFRAKMSNQDSCPTITLELENDMLIPLREYSCIKCGKKVIEQSPDTNWYDGCIFENSAGYGSKHDLDVFKIMVCDGCLDNIKKNLKDNK